MTTDNGGAPCCSDDLWSLAICKPRIRTSAKEGNVIVGFAGNYIDSNNGIIYVARISEKVQNGDYYDPESIYSMRADCIYSRVGNNYEIKKDNGFHSEDDKDRDLGKSRGHAHVLLSTDFRYFGGDHPFHVEWQNYRNLLARVKELRQGERVNHVDDVFDELHDLVQRAFGATDKKIIGAPKQKQPSRCNQDDNCEEGVCNKIPKTN